MEFQVGGKITAKEYDEVISQFREDLATSSKVNILERVSDWKGIEPLALWKDIKFAVQEFGHVNEKVEKAAVVADQKWIESVTNLLNPFIDTEVKFFKPNEEEKARQWLETVVPENL